MSPDPLLETDALFLDFDGTLVEIADHPGRVVLPDNLPALLAAVQRRLGGALAIVSGRRLEDVDAWLHPRRFPGAGVHGAQLRRDGAAAFETLATTSLAPVAAELETALAALPGAWLEDKGSSLAIHYRDAPRSGDACASLADAVAGRHGLHALRGKMVVELRQDGVDKGAALRALMREPAFRGRRPVFVGDDVTDEDGFAAAAELGGHGVRVGDGPSDARYRLADVPAAIAWLDASAGEAMAR